MNPRDYEGLSGARRWPPQLNADEMAAVTAAARSGEWTGGPWTAAVEDAMRDLTGAPYAVAFSSCTSAIHAALAAYGCAPVTKVTAPALTFAGTVTGARHQRAQLAYTDADPFTLATAPADPGPGGIAIGVDLHGVPHDGERVHIGEAPVITDSCQAIGTTVNGVHLGAAGTHAWSFSSAKLVAAPDGGAITTSDGYLASLLLDLRDYGLDLAAGHDRSNAVVIHRDGHNWRPSEWSMALVACRLQALPALAARTRAVYARFARTFGTLELWYQQAPPGTAPAWHKIRFGHHTQSPAIRENAARALTAAGVPVHRWGAVPLHQHPAFRPRWPADVPVAEDAAAGTLCLGTEAVPPHTWTDSEVEDACTALERVFGG